MPKLSKKLREMWEFFIDPITNRRKYYPKCCRCTHNCKQSFRVTGLWCPRYEPKNARGRNAGNQASERRKRTGNIMTYPILKTALTAEAIAENGTQTAVK